MNGTEKQNETSMEMPAEDSRVTMGNQTEKKHRFHLKMPQKGRKHSVKKRIAYTFIATMAATLLIIGLINYFFLGSFYIRDKEHILAESFQKLNATGGDSDNIPDTFEQFCATNNLKVIITGPELSSFVYSNATDRQSLQTLIFGLISGNEQANTKVVDIFDRGRDRDPAHPEHPDKLRFRWDPVTCLQTAIPDLAYNMIFDLYIFRGVEFLVICA